MMTRWGVPLLLLSLLAVSSWLLEELGLDRADRNQRDLQNKPDYAIDNFTTVIMDEKGLPKRRLQAKRMVHYAATGIGKLEEPYMIFFAVGSEGEAEEKYAGGNPLQVYPIWHVRSEQGQVLDDGKTVYLLGKVHMWKNDDTGTMELDIRTRDLKVLPGSHYGETNQAAVIRTVTTETRGIGMRAHIKPGRMELLSQVQTIYNGRNND
uniref:Lipopolysaccharide export system protein LptC n=1 Tax=Candidatus Kentrum sp. DK TaxID=2126562 RepID=A0A450RUP1_9GAMM|nr:MAG: LPS export ABC transporter protein LptC [Candidatus Kentron sp. DK]